MFWLTIKKGRKLRDCLVKTRRGAYTKSKSKESKEKQERSAEHGNC